MKKRLLLSVILCIGLNSAMAQSKTVAADLYFDYTLDRMDESKNDITIKRAEELLKRSSELNDKQIANVSFHLARIYETKNLAEKSVPLYETAIRLAPGYYVTYRALGYINLKKCDTLGRKVTEYAKQKNQALYEESYKIYKAQTLKTIAYFEKAEACDPDDRTMGILNTLYKSIKDTTSLPKLQERLLVLGKDCTTILDDE